ncbi:MAG: HAD hydrolase-like protein [Candidatus Marinimicrobia bacterium]|nr:HAD hydrolase-like protein [Candidatus Neomarinimicrobiota bacterium]
MSERPCRLSRDVRGLMVGDSVPDMAFGKVAGLKRIAVSYGYNDVPSLRDAGAHAVIDSLKELKDIAEICTGRMK